MNVSPSQLLLCPPLQPVYLARLRERYVAEFSKSGAFHRRASTVLAGGNTKALAHVDPFPLAADQGKGATIRTVEGAGLVDLQCAYGAHITGYSNPAIDRAVTRQLKTGGHLFGGAVSEVQRALAEAVCARVPSMELVRFTNSGTEAVMFAIRLARVWTGRDKVMLFRGGYHGTTDVALLAGGGHSSGVPSSTGGQVVLATFNDVSGTNRLIRECRKELACVVFEPTLGAGGVVKGTVPFGRMLRDTCSECGVLLVADEIFTLRAAYGGICEERFGISPDLMTLGKIIGGGYPIGCFGGRRDLMELCAPPTSPDSKFLYHSGTFNGHLISMASGFESLRLYDRAAVKALCARGDTLAARLREGISRVRRDYPSFRAQLLHDGPILQIHFCIHPIVSAADVPQGGDHSLAWYRELLMRGFFTIPRGLFLLSLAHTDEQLRAFAKAHDEVIFTLARNLREGAAINMRSGL